MYDKNKYFHYALENIPCEFPNCKCPYKKKEIGRYSFVYIHEQLSLIYYSVPKASSSSIRHNFFNNNHVLSIANSKRSEENYFKFTFVRNPWDRVISTWKMFTQRPNLKMQLENLTGKWDYTLGGFLDVIANYQNHHWQPQSIFVPENIDFIGYLDTFEEDMMKLHFLLKIPFNRNLWKNKKNKTIRNSNYQDYFKHNQQLIEKVHEIYESDIKRFQFKY